MESLAARLLPCDTNGECMACKNMACEEDTLTCNTCATPWHLPCLGNTFPCHASSWDCPDCSSLPDQPMSSVSYLTPAVDPSEKDKGKRPQYLVSPSNINTDDVVNNNQVLGLLEENLKCSFCMQLPQSPVTTLCGHNFCLKCFQKWVGQGKRTCAKCRSAIPPKMASNPCINSSLVLAIQIAQCSPLKGPARSYDFVQNRNQPCQTYSNDSAKIAGKEEGSIFVTVPPDHFGPILAENDSLRNQGVLVGDIWESWIECRQWGAHISQSEGISGQSDYGAQSVAFSSSNEDVEDHGDWFLYTGSNDGRDLLKSGETSKQFYQKVETLNEALHISFQKGYPVRVVRFSAWKIFDQTEVHHSTTTISAGYKKDADNCCQYAEFEDEDRAIVHVRREHIFSGKCMKLRNRNIGPYKILHKINSNIYVLDMPDNMEVSNIFNKKDLFKENTIDYMVNNDTCYLPPSYVYHEIEDIVDTKVVSTRGGSYQKYLVKWKSQGWSECTWICDDEFQHFNCDLYKKYHYFNSSESPSSKRPRDNSYVPERFGKCYTRDSKSSSHFNMNLFDRLQKKKLPSYAPTTGIRYDGIYRIEKCWLKVCNDGCKVPQYLFVRCDNNPAPWSSDMYINQPRSLPYVKELKTAAEVTQRKESPSWDYNYEKERWMWVKSPPVSQKHADSQKLEDARTRKARSHAQSSSVRDRLLKEFSCLICRKVIVLPLTTPCAHSFCKSCLLAAFAGQPSIRQRKFEGWRTLRDQKNIMKCPSCATDIFDFLQNPQVNTELMNVVKSLLHQVKWETI